MAAGPPATGEACTSQQGVPPQVSVVVPLYNEQENVRPLHASIVAAMDRLGLPYEIVLVDDGSTDSTFEIARELSLRDPRVCVIRFRRNYGQTAAMSAGLQHGRADVLITMDGDLQNDPEDIRYLLEKVAEGYDVVVGYRVDRQDAVVTRLIPSRVANWLIARITGVRIRDNGCSLKAYRAAVIRQVPLYADMHRFIPAMAFMAGARITEVGVRHHPRRRGASKYGLSRVYKVLLDIATIKTITAFTARPLYLFALMSVPAGVLGVLLLLDALLVGAAGGGLSIPLFGSGLVLVTAASSMLLSGTLGELAYHLSDMRGRIFVSTTLRVVRTAASSSRGSAA